MENGFTKIDNSILSRALIELDGNQFKVLTVILKYSYGDKGESHPTQKTIAEETNLSESTVKRTIKVLQQKNFITVSKHKNYSGTDNNIYHINSQKEIKNKKETKKIMARNLKNIAVADLNIFKGPKMKKKSLTAKWNYTPLQKKEMNMLNGVKTNDVDSTCSSKTITRGFFVGEDPVEHIKNEVEILLEKLI